MLKRREEAGKHGKRREKLLEVRLFSQNAGERPVVAFAAPMIVALPPLECGGLLVPGRFPNITSGDALLLDEKHLPDISIYPRAPLRCDGILAGYPRPSCGLVGVLFRDSRRKEEDDFCQPVRLLSSNREADCLAFEIAWRANSASRERRLELAHDCGAKSFCLSLK